MQISLHWIESYDWIFSMQMICKWSGRPRDIALYGTKQSYRQIWKSLNNFTSVIKYYVDICWNSFKGAETAIEF